MRSTVRSSGVAIIVLIVATLLAQLPLMLKVKIVEYDEAIFCDVARNIQRTGLPLRSIGSQGVLFFDHTPLYTYFLSVYVDLGISFGRWITTLVSLGCVLLAYIAGKCLNGQSAGFAGALLLGIHPFIALYSFFLRMEIFCLFFLVVGLALLVSYVRKDSNRHWLITGVALAIAALFKQIALVFTVICGIYVLIRFWKKRAFLWKTLLSVVGPSVVALLIWMLWGWHLSPAEFTAAMQRWAGAALSDGQDPRTSLTSLQWARRIVVDLLGPGLTVLWALSVVYSLVRKKLASVDWVLLGYPIGAIFLSFLIRLKEPRHLIGILPCIALFIGTKIDWDTLLVWAQTSRWRGALLLVTAALFLFSISPMRLPLENPRDLRAWFDPLYAWRLFENDRYYNVLRLAGLYLQEHTPPEEIITVVHEATVTAYYANRHYYMLYTLPLERVLRILEETRYLVWDHEFFYILNEEQKSAVREYVNQHFLAETVIRDEYREVTIYRRRED